MALRRAVCSLLPKIAQPAAETLGPAANHAASSYSHLMSGPLDLTERQQPAGSFRCKEGSDDSHGHLGAQHSSVTWTLGASLLQPLLLMLLRPLRRRLRSRHATS